MDDHRSRLLFWWCGALALLTVSAGRSQLPPEAPSPPASVASPAPELPGGRIPESDPAFVARLPAGPIPRGAVLPNGRRVHPVGASIPVGLLPLGMALSPDGRWLAVLNDGRIEESIDLIDTHVDRVVYHQPLEMAFIGIVFAPDGRTLWVAGGGSQSVLRFDLNEDAATLTPSGQVRAAGYPTGLTFSQGHLFCAENYGNRVVEIDPASAQVIRTFECGRMPYALTPAGGKIWVSSWADGAVEPLQQGTRAEPVAIGKLAGPMVSSADGRYLYACAVDDDLLVAIDTAAGHPRVVQSLRLAPQPRSPVGSVPAALAVNPTDGDLYVALSGLNAVAVVDSTRFQVRGLIPTAWYPTALAVSPDGAHLYAAAGKGLGSGPNKASGRSVAMLQTGTVSDIPVTGPQSAADSLAAWTRTVIADSRPVALTDALPRLPPIHHVIYVVKENRTYDQVLGDLGRGEGDASLAFYGRQVTPNAHALADRFAMSDNFFCDGEVSSQGHQWTLGANSPDYTERTWTQSYAGHSRINDNGESVVSYPSGGYFIHACVRKHISCRMYGDALMRDEKGKLLPGLASHDCPTFRGWDLDYPDVKREAAWEAEFKKGIFPRFSYVWFPNDHTSGTRLGAWTPRAMVADNDQALGRLVQAVSHSRYWKDTAIFVTEDDAQDGLDHVDAHRSLLLVISPWAKAGGISPQHYSQVSISRTIEMLVHLPPLSQYDASAVPLTDLFSTVPTMRAFEALAPLVDTGARNGPQAAMSRESSLLDLTGPDANPNGALERILLADARSGIVERANASSRRANGPVAAVQGRIHVP